MASLQPSSAGHQPNPLMRWTTYPSLLCSLSTTHVDLLERAICASQYGRYVEATEIFHATWPAIHKEPIAALELSEMLKVQTLEHERKQILQEALTSLRIEKRCPKQYFCEVEALTKLLLADATFWVSGNLMASFKAARIFNEWYRERAKSTPNDVEIRGIIMYYEIMDLCRGNSNWVDDNIDGIFFPDRQNKPWTELREIRRELLSQNRYKEACRLVMIEFSWRKNEEKDALCEELLAICQKMKTEMEIPLLYRAVFAYFFLANELQAIGRQESAQQYHDTSMNLLRSLPHATNGLSQFAPRLDLDYRTIEIKKSSCLTDLEKKEQLLGLLPEAELRNDQGKIRRLLMDAVIMARNWFRKDPNIKKFVDYQTLQARRLSFEQSTAKLPYFEAAALTDSFGTLGDFLKDWHGIIGEVNRFKHRYPGTLVPRIEEWMYGYAKDAAKATGQMTIFQQYNQEWKKAYLECFAARDSQDKYELSADVLDDRNKYFRELQGADPAQRRFTAMKASLRWAKSEHRNGLMSKQEFLDIFDLLLPSGDEQSDFDAYLERIDHVDMTDILYGDDYPSPDKIWKSCFPRIETWLQLDRPPFLEARHSVWRVMQEARNFQLSTFMAARAGRLNRESAQQIIDGDEHLQYIYECVVEGSRFPDDALQCMSRKIKNVFMLSCIEKCVEHRFITDEVLQTAVLDCENLIQRYEDRGSHFHAYFQRTQLSRLLMQKLVHFRSVEPEVALKPLEEAHELFWQLHRDQTSWGPSQSIVAKSKMSEFYQLWLLYEQALWCCWLTLLKSISDYQQAIQDEERAAERLRSIDRDFGIFIKWAQRSKARILNESLGADARLPGVFIAQVESSQSAVASLHEEADLSSTVEDCLLERRLDIQKKLQSLRAKMRADPILKPVMDFREGKTVDVEGINQMLTEMPPNILFLDYVYITNTKTFYMIPIRHGANNVPYQIPNVTLEDVNKWVEANVNKKEGEEALDWASAGTKAGSNPLRAMDTVIKPLFSLQVGGQPLLRKGDILVLSPTKSLHRVPFHALLIDSNTPLIERHPVVYVQSLSILRHCVPDNLDPNGNHVDQKSTRSTSPPPPKQQQKKTIVHPLSQSEPSHLSVQTLTNSLSADFLSGSTLTAEGAMAHLAGSSLVHYYGHISFHARGPLASGLCLNEAARRSTPRCIIEGAQTLTAEMIYDQLRLENRALVTLIGCNSGAAQVSKEDDLNGLVTAFLIAGAGAVVSTLWPIDKDDGLRFAEAFYGELEREERELMAWVGEGKEQEGRKEEERDWGSVELDLARAMQVGVEAVRWEDVEDKEDNNDENDSRKANKEKESTRVRDGMSKRRRQVERKPYHWAGFVLNGYWKVRGPLFSNGNSRNEDDSTSSRGGDDDDGSMVLALRSKLGKG